MPLSRIIKPSYVYLTYTQTYISVQCSVYFILLRFCNILFVARSMIFYFVLLHFLSCFFFGLIFIASIKLNIFS